ncbi:GntR family transcriptional regulator, partial [Escherichia coli]|uniref:GntR family transcriptional regulator n=1 Tax=Escherichia coli TaxID=562 RepID=UPI00201B0676
MTRYQHLATLLAERIEQGLYRHGEKLPSVRSLSREHGVSGFAPIFPDICYHLTHYKPAAADIPV